MQSKQSNPINTNKSNDKKSNSSKYGAGVVGLTLTVPSMIPNNSALYGNLTPYVNLFMKNATRWGIVALSVIIVYNLTDVVFKHFEEKN